MGWAGDGKAMGDRDSFLANQDWGAHSFCIFADDSSHTSIKVPSVGIREGNFSSLFFFSFAFTHPQQRMKGRIQKG